MIRTPWLEATESGEAGRKVLVDMHAVIAVREHHFDGECRILIGNDWICVRVSYAALSEMLKNLSEVPQ